MSIVLGFIGTNGMWLPLELPNPIPDGWVVMVDGERPNDKCYANSAGKWVMGLSPDQKEEAIKSAEQTKTILISVASNKISTLKDRIEAGQDRDAELKLWKAYRIALDDIDTSLAPDIEWPVSPE
ncbi:tail assembly chaperone gp38 [Yersinia intermedia]|uniref:tail fiber assembly protein n=1 Tax=Yersinia intermedia TaxID=631 RepID=UPI0005E3D2BC|nr:tail fiber assembly protein [Yersinia intermedia]CNH63438.1 tail assembly chaperone gp38 [Yersinia intermedia]